MRTFAHIFSSTVIIFRIGGGPSDALPSSHCDTNDDLPVLLCELPIALFLSDSYGCCGHNSNEIHH